YLFSLAAPFTPSGTCPDRGEESGGIMTALKVGLCGAMVAACVANPLQAQTRAVSTLQSGLAMAQCPGPVPCDTGGITFQRGSVRIRKVKQPDPIYSTFIGTISLQG